MKTPTQPFVISGYDVLGEVLRRNREREQAACPLVDVRTHRARLGTGEEVESNLPIPHSEFRNPTSP